MTKIKLCDITHFYATKSGGVKTYLLNKTAYINSHNCDIAHFLILPSENNRVEVKEKSCFYFIKSPKVPFAKPYRAIIDRKNVIEIILREKPDIVEVGSPYIIPTWIKKLRDKIGYKILGFYHADIERTWCSITRSYHLSNLIADIAQSYIRNTYQDMDLVITPSKYVEQYLNKLGITRTKTIYLGINSDLFSVSKPDDSFKERYGIGKNKIILLYVGRFSKEKRLLKLIELFKKLNLRKPGKYHLILVGGGPEEKKILNNGTKDITVLPYCYDKEKLVTIYNSSDIFVTASNSETFGLTILEAQSCGLPVVSFMTTSIPEIVFNKDYLASTDDEFIKKIEIVSDLLSGELRNKIRDFSVNLFSWDKTFRNLFELYRKVYDGTCYG